MMKTLVLGVLLGCLLVSSEAAPSAKNDKNKSIIFNVWEFARVSGPKLQRPQKAKKETVTVSPEEEGPNECTYAIIACCQSKDKRRINQCFNSLGCEGAWFSNLCNPKLLQAALKSLG